MKLPSHITPPAPKRSAPDRAPVYALVGNPNTGKSTLFSALAGVRQRVGNYPGVTVEKKTGTLRHGDQHFELIDLPGFGPTEMGQFERLTPRTWRRQAFLFLFVVRC